MAASALRSPATHAVRSASAIVCKEVSDSHVLRIHGYSRLKHMMHGKYIRSGDFHAGGHIWRLLYYPNGSQPQFQDHIAVYLQLASRDPSDEQVLARPRFSLLDQLGNPALPHDCGMHRFSYSSREVGRGARNFITREGLEKSEYLKDDRFAIQCDVSVTNVRTCSDHWAFISQH